MAEQSITPKKDKKVALSLDEMTRDDAPEDFYVEFGGQLVQFIDPVEIDFRDLDEIQQPEMFTRFCVTADTRDHFRKQTLETWKFKRLMDAYSDHFRLDELVGNHRASRS